MLLFISIFILSFICPSQSVYTNKEAYQCFQQKGVPNCNEKIQECVSKQACKNQLQKYQSCQFSQEKQHIFNGYCFRVWQQQAVQTAELANCFVNECDLIYNSDIGLKELFKCTEEQIFQNYKQCDDQCKSELHKIQSKFHSEKLSELFSMSLDHQVADNVVTLIRQNCIQKFRLGKNKEVQEEGEL